MTVVDVVGVDVVDDPLSAVVVEVVVVAELLDAIVVDVVEDVVDVVVVGAGIK
jgi:hypothetical protein